MPRLKIKKPKLNLPPFRFAPRRPFPIRLYIELGMLGIAVFALSLTLWLRQQEAEININTAHPIIEHQELAHALDITDIELTVDTFATVEQTIDTELAPVAALPAFAKFENATLTLAPQKYDVGEFSITFAPNDRTATYRTVVKINAAPAAIDAEAIKNEVLAILGAESPNYGVYVEDLLREQTFGINHDQIFPPASISKLPSAVLLLRDVEAGKYTLDQTYPITARLKHSTFDSLGKLAVGTPVTLREYLRLMLTESNNTAQYHLRVFLGDSWDVINPRTNSELGLGNFYENPLTAIPSDVGKLYADIYRHKTLGPEQADYFWSVLGGAVAGLREGIPAALRGYNAQVVNKVGFLFGARENTYSDSALVKGTTTDYVIVILNKYTPQPWPYGSEMIRSIAEVVHKGLN